MADTLSASRGKHLEGSATERTHRRAVAWADLAAIGASERSCVRSIELEPSLIRRRPETAAYARSAADAFAIEVGPDHELAEQHRLWAASPEDHPRWK
jgi:hypothetical protein